VPGPVCYDQGGKEVTLTDANVALGYLHPERLPSGLRLAAEKARRAVAEQIAAPLGIGVADAAHGVYLLGCAGMARAVRAVTIERGRDPREFTLVAFGGNGPLFAAEMARSLEIGTILVPPAPGVFSALGLLEAEVEHHLVKTFLRPLLGTKPSEIAAAVAELEREAEALLRGEGSRARVDIERSVDLKYQGQSFELTVPLPPAWTDEALRQLAASFGVEHERTYGHKAEGDPIQMVNLRLTARVLRPAERAAIRLEADRTVQGGNRPAYFGPAHGEIATPIITRAALGATTRSGPLLIDEYDATTLIPPDCAARLDAHGNIVITTGGTR
jgi:N-methylhydantoinase A